MGILKDRKLSEKLLVPVVLLLVCTFAGVTLYLWKATTQSAVDSAIMSAEKTVSQFKTLRGYYTENVVKKVKGIEGVEVTIDHEGREGAIPLPATMIHELSGLLESGGDGVKLRLYSDFPFPNRQGRTLDGFAREALDALKANPEESFVKRDVVGGTEVVRVARADVMGSACVGCHNSHPDTPKNDWKAGDVRGVLEVVTPIDSVLAANASMLTKTSIILLAAVTIIALILSFVAKKFITRPIARVIEYFAEGQDDLTRRLPVESKDEVGELSRWYNTYMDRLQGIIKDIRSSTNHLASSSEELSAASMQIANGSRDQSSRAGQVSTASQEMSSTLTEVARNVNGAAEAAGEANMVASSGGETVERTIASMRGISETARESNEIITSLGSRSEEIGKIISVIDDIADQTNLLALNAAIEAARAGEQGRGFAVVADEVRSLAEKTMKATKEIGGMINSMQNETGLAITSMEKEVGAVEEGVKHAEEAGESLQAIVRRVEDVTSMVQQISTAAEEQTAATEQITGDIDSIASVVNETSTSAQQVARASEELSELAGHLKNTVAMFKLSDDAGYTAGLEAPAGPAPGGPDQTGAENGPGKVVPFGSKTG